MSRKSAFLAGVLGLLALATGVSAQPTDTSGLHDALHLTPAQEAAWRRYRLAVAPDPTAQARHEAAQSMMATLPTPRRIDLINAEMQADLDLMQKQGEAVKSFYATLTPEQRLTFDRQTTPTSDQGPPSN